MRVLGIVGFSGAGKTTLLERLIAVLVRDGVRVAAMKHAHHGFEPDVRGKDSDRLRRAGAVQTLAFSDDVWALVVTAPPPRDLAGLCTLLQKGHVDLVLVEGLRDTAYPKLEVFRPSKARPLLCLQNPDVIAVATDVPGELSGLPCPVLHLDDTAAIARFVRCWLRQGEDTMSEATTPPADPNNPDNTSNATDPGNKGAFDDLRDKLETHLDGLGKQIDELSERFHKTAHEAKASVEADLEKLKEKHKDEYDQLQKLQKTAQESWGVFQKRLDSIAHDMAEAVGSAVGTAANALGIGSDNKSEGKADHKTEDSQAAPALACTQASTEAAAPAQAPASTEGTAPTQAPADTTGASSQDAAATPTADTTTPTT